MNELKAFIVTADEQLRSELRGLRTAKIVARCSRFRDSAKRPIDERCTRHAMRSLAQRVQHLEAEIGEHDAEMKTLIDRAAPQLIAERGVGYVTAAAFYLAWSHPGRSAAKPPTPDSAAPHPLRSPPARTKTGTG